MLTHMGRPAAIAAANRLVDGLSAAGIVSALPAEDIPCIEARLRDAVTPLTDPLWERTLNRLPPEGFYTLPDDLQVGDSGVWRKNAIIQLGYNPQGEGILFVGERHEGLEVNALFFAERGVRIPDELLYRLVWAPILPVSPPQEAYANRRPVLPPGW